jgi:hypothetical protein
MSINKLTGTLVYVQMDAPKPCFVEDKGFEWKASIVVSEDDAEAWDDTFPKQTAKQVKTADFEAMYKIAAPFPNQRKQYVITLRKNTKLGNGSEVPLQYQPKVFQQKGNTLVDVTKSVLPANGSIGAISVDSFEGKMGTFARLKNVLVTDMIAYEKKDSSGSDGSEFGFQVAKKNDQEDAEDDFADRPKPTPSKAVKTPTKPSKAVPALDEDDSEMSPF